MGNLDQLLAQEVITQEQYDELKEFCLNDIAVMLTRILCLFYDICKKIYSLRVLVTSYGQ